MTARTVIFFFFLSFVLAVTVTSCREDIDQAKVVARVEDEVLTLDELYSRVPPHIRANLSDSDIREFVLRWIDNQVLYQEALQRDLDQSPDFVKEVHEIRKELLINRLVEGSLSNSISVTEDEIQQYYQDYQESFILSEDMVHAYHVMLSSKTEANKVRQKLVGGADFREVAEDSLTEESWDLGYFSEKEVIPEIARAVFRLGVGRVSYPIQSDFGYHVLQVVDKVNQGDVQKFDLVREDIRLKLEGKKKQDIYERFVLQMKSKFKIKTNFTLIDSILSESHSANGENSR